MKKEDKIVYFVVFLVLLSIVVGWLGVSAGYFSSSNLLAVTVSGIITTLNFTLGLFAIKLGLKRSDQFFMALFFGGMIVRLTLLLTSVIISLTVLELKQNSFIFSIFIFYILYLITEVVHLIFKRH
ncbi:MAG: hypothetical protein K8H86_08200 [Ignavibacteriaceae bacterium]|nr:hypothetical protein [Ignavibacteriaceae bacterium]